METALTKAFGVQYPIIQGGMGWGSEAGLVSAVSMAGGMGTIGAGGRTPEWLRAEIRAVKGRTPLPFAVNIPLPDPQRDSFVDVVCEEKVPVAALGGGKPPVELYRRLKEHGVKILSVVPTVSAALCAEKAGADAVVLEGTEGGGHCGAVTTMVLMSEMTDALTVPVVAAGGIVDGRGLAAALMMGASGVQIGTAFMVAEECEIHPRAKQRILEAGSRDIVVTGDLRRKIEAVRGIRNAFAEEFFALQDSNAPQEEMNKLAAGTSRRGQMDGDLEHGFIMAGMVVGPLKEIRAAGDIVRAIMKEAEARLLGAGEFLR